LISKGTVTECSASDLTTGFVGQAGAKTREVFRSALGSLLFIDEAYRLNPEKGGAYMREALDEVVQLLTERDFKNNMAVVIAGYQEDMAMLFNVNPGLKSRIQTTLTFEKFSATDACTYLKRKLHDKEVRVDQKDEANLLSLCDDLVIAPHWSNGRDVDTLANQIFQKHALRVTDRAAPLSELSASASAESECSDVVHFSVIKAVFDQVILQKKKSAGASHGAGAVGPLHGRYFVSDLPRFTLPDASTSQLDPQLSTSSLQGHNEDCTDQEVLNHFEGFEADFLLDIQTTLTEMGVDIRTLEQVATFDIQKLFSKFGTRFDLVKQWQSKICAAWEQAKRMEEELARKERAKRPKWRCAICGRAFCRVAPYIEGYEDVEL